MTREEEVRLRELTTLVDRLKRLMQQNRTLIDKQQEKIELLTMARDKLHRANEELRSKNDLLLSARVIVADDGDWLQARKRLENLQKEILRGIKLLETE